jgi:hypothetical protein
LLQYVNQRNSISWTMIQTWKVINQDLK